MLTPQRGSLMRHSAKELDAHSTKEELDASLRKGDGFSTPQRSWKRHSSKEELVGCTTLQRSWMRQGVGRTHTMRNDECGLALI